MINRVYSFLLLVFFSFGWSLWTPTSGPTGGDVRALLVVGDTLYMGTERGAAFRSDDGGNSWKAINNGLPYSSIYGFTVGRNSLYAYPFGVFRSQDQGDSWEDISNGLNNINFVAAYDTVLFAYNSGQGFYRSRDNGTNWEKADTGITSSNISSFTSIGSVLFASNYGDGVYRSLDEGSSWTLINSGLTSLFVLKLISMDSILLAGTFGGVFRSLDSGKTWTAINNGLINNRTSVLSVRDDRLVIGTSDGIYESLNNGESWTKLSGTPNNLTSLSLTQSSIFVGSQSGVLRSMDNGGTWNTIHTGLLATQIQTLELVGNKLFAGLDNQGLSYTTDEGLNWHSLDSVLSVRRVFGLASGDSTLFAATSSGIWKSLDSGKSWRSSGPSGNIAWSLTKNGDKIFSGFNNGDVNRSLDNGINWTTHPIGLTTTRVNSLLFWRGVLLAGTGQGVFRSTDDGVSWTEANTGRGQWNVPSFGVRDSIVFSADGGGVHRSLDSGKSWTQINNGLNNANLSSLFVRDGILYVGATNGIVSYSSDNGNSWATLDSGLSNRTVNSISATENYLTAGLNGAGVWKRPFAPSQILLFQPLSGNILTTDSALLSWHPAIRIVDEYFMELAYDSNFNTIAQSFNTRDTTQWVKSLLNDTTYYWRVRARNGGGDGPESEIRSFIVRIPVPIGSARKKAKIGLESIFGNKLRYHIPHTSRVLLALHNLKGAEVMGLVNDFKNAGSYSIQVPRLPEGVYWVRLKAGKISLDRLIYLMR